MSDEINSAAFYEKVVAVLQESRRTVVQTINSTMVAAYCEVGRMIVEEEQNGASRASYGKELLKNLSIILTREFGKGFSVTNIQQMRIFYLTYQKQQTLSDKSGKAEKVFDLSWSHYLQTKWLDRSEKQLRVDAAMQRAELDNHNF